MALKASDPYAAHKDTENPLHTASFCTEKLVHADAFTQRQGSFYSQKAFTQSKLLHRKLYIEKLLHAASFHAQEAFTHRSFYTEKPLNREAFTHSKL